MICWRSLVVLCLATVGCRVADDGDVEQPPIDSAQVVSQRILAEQLVVRLIKERGGENVAVEINYEVLDSLVRVYANEPSPLSDPLSAARVFAWAVGLPPGTEFELLERTHQAGEGSGLLTARVRARAGDVPIIMRLVSDPGDPRQPAVWTLNDYELGSR